MIAGVTRTAVRSSRRLLSRHRSLGNGNSLKQYVRPAVLSNIPNAAASAFYSTEKVLALRSGKDNTNNLQANSTLYRSENEKENCGVGMVASLKSAPSRRVIEDADEMLVRMSHRGGCGCDPASGDGAGKYLKLITWDDHYCYNDFN